MYLRLFLTVFLTGLSIFQAACAESSKPLSKTGASGGFLLKSPPSITPEVLEERISSLPMEMNWSSTNKTTGGAWRLGFDHKEGKTFLKLQFIKKLPDKLRQSEKSQFIKVREGDLDIWTYTHGAPSQPLETKPQMPPSLEEAMGMVGSPLVIEEANRHPQPITVTDLAYKIQDQKVVFYTGAGISAGVVPTMSDLMQSLGLPIKEEKAMVALTQNILANPASYIAVMDEFYQACYYGKPTAAHLALKGLVTLKSWGLLTENLDLLQQRSGIDPLTHGTPNWLKSSISEDDLKAIDVVVTIGLQSDESGFLGWYKKHNPKGQVIAVNLHVPIYVGKEDFILQGDAQALVGELYKVLLAF